MKRIYPLYAILIILIIISGCKKNKVQLKPVKGIFNLTEWNFHNDGSVKLDGEWEFYWNQLLTPEDFKNKKILPPKIVNIPKVWNNYKINDNNLPSHGFATYRLLIKTPYKGKLAISKLHPNTSFIMYINGEILLKAGRTGKDSKKAKSGSITKVTDFNTDGKDFEIIIQVSNYSYFLGGLWHSFKLGKKTDIINNHEKDIAYDLFLFGILLYIGIYFTSFYLLRKKENSFFFFGIFSFILAIRTLFINHIFILNLFPCIQWELIVKVNFLTFILLFVMFLKFTSTLYGEFTNKIINFIIYTLSGIYSIIIILFNANIYSKILPYYQVVMIFIGIYLTYIFLKAVFRKREGAIVVFSGYLILFLTAINDILIAKDIIYSIQLAPLGFLFFIFAQSFNLSKRLVHSFNLTEELSINLDKKVKTRTIELELEKNKLKSRNKIIEMDLMLAKKIQQQMIPSVAPVDYICSFYKSMDQVGGDFYDFFRFRDYDKIGIFLSDVSGHGVAAAFITSMIKSMIIQSGKKREDPAELLTYLNKMLLNQTAEHFVTAFYGIYDQEDSTLVYANAGHNNPYILKKNSIKMLEGNKGIPLAIADDDFFKLNNKKYKNNTIKLEKNSKLILYTDGLTETVKINDSSKNFEDEMLEKVFLDIYNLSSKDFIKSLYKELLEFRGSNSFDDDICIICMNIKK